jgi:hypothetical protein
MKRFADDLDTKREIYEEASSGDDARVLSPTARGAIEDLYPNMEGLSRLLKNLASLMESYQVTYQEPAKPGELTGKMDDLNALDQMLGKVTKLMTAMVSKVNAAREVLPGRGGGPNSNQVTSEGRPYRSEPVVAAAGYRYRS